MIHHWWKKSGDHHLLLLKRYEKWEESSISTGFLAGFLEINSINTLPTSMQRQSSYFFWGGRIKMWMNIILQLSDMLSPRWCLVRGRDTTNPNFMYYSIFWGKKSFNFNLIYILNNQIESSLKKLGWHSNHPLLLRLPCPPKKRQTKNKSLEVQRPLKQ